MLPSQQGFTEDLQASNVIQPIIDLTPTAEGSAVGTALQEAMSFGGVTSYQRSGGTGTTTVVNTPGFWRVQLQISVEGSVATDYGALNMTQALSTKVLYKAEPDPGSGSLMTAASPAIFTIFVQTNETLQIETTANSQVNCQVWQIADVNGNLVNPTGFSPQ